MNNHSDKHHRRSIRWAGYDYSQGGAYFITICVARRVRRNDAFGRVLDGVMQRNVYGEMVAEEWLRTATLRPNVVLDEWVVMPNHFHGILMIGDDASNTLSRRGVARQAPTSRQTAQFSKPQPNSLGTIIGAFKSAVTRRISAHRSENNLAPVNVWQRNYFERVIRNENELDDTRRYIAQNPTNWENDEHFARRIEKSTDSHGADVSALEREIDELVADLYGLNEDEKKLVGLG